MPTQPATSELVQIDAMPSICGREAEISTAVNHSELIFLPTSNLRLDQMTAGLAAPVTVAVSCLLPLIGIVTEVGEMATVTTGTANAKADNETIMAGSINSLRIISNRCFVSA